MKHQLRGRPVCLIGSDIPDLTPQHISKAFKALRSHDTVFGPAPDGGFWLVGCSARRPLPTGVFAGARWSTEHALRDSLASLEGRSVAFVDTLQDVDTGADLPQK